MANRPDQKQPATGDTPRTPDMGVALVVDVPSGTTSEPGWGRQPVSDEPRAPKGGKKDG